MWLKSFFKKLYYIIVELLYPKHCAVCDKHLLMFADIPLCSECALVKHVPKCIRDDKYSFDEAVCALKYEGEVRNVFHKYKFENIKYYAKAYAYFMDKATEDRKYMRDAVICPVPLSSGRDRLYNQTAVIAKELAARWDTENVEELLYKSREINPLSQMKLPERRFYMEDAISVNPECRVSGRDVLLIDDIFTSGTTAGECAKVLKAYGARKVYVLCACYD